jgi:hypothetical protein
MAETKLAFSIPEFCEASGLCRSNVYVAIREGRLIARKHGRRTIIAAEDGKAFIATLPRAEGARQNAA